MDAQQIAASQDRELIQSALDKRKRGKRLTSAEIAALARAEERRLLDGVQRLPPKTFATISGLQTKQMHDWENRYAIPCGRGRESINLLDVFTAIRAWIADEANAAKGSAGGKGSQPKKAELLERQIRKLEQQIRKLENENEENEGRTIPKESLVEHHERLAAQLRNLGDNFARKQLITGAEAQAMLNATLQTYQRELIGLKRRK